MVPVRRRGTSLNYGCLSRQEQIEINHNPQHIHVMCVGTKKRQIETKCARGSLMGEKKDEWVRGGGQFDNLWIDL